jgi:tRNA(fMet)-specific endonuclease VapC
MGVILDTSLLIALERRVFDLDTFIQGREEEPFGISVITAAELLHGVHRADSVKKRLKREAFVEKIIESFTLYHFDMTTARLYARLWANLARQGIKVGAHDLMIAATALAYGFSVATFDIRDYGKIKELTLETVKK